MNPYIINSTEIERSMSYEYVIFRIFNNALNHLREGGRVITGSNYSDINNPEIKFMYSGDIKDTDSLINEFNKYSLYKLIPIKYHDLMVNVNLLSKDFEINNDRHPKTIYLSKNEENILSLVDKNDVGNIVSIITTKGVRVAFPEFKGMKVVWTNHTFKVE